MILPTILIFFLLFQADSTTNVETAVAVIVSTIGTGLFTNFIKKIFPTDSFWNTVIAIVLSFLTAVLALLAVDFVSGVEINLDRIIKYGSSVFVVSNFAYRSWKKKIGE